MIFLRRIISRSFSSTSATSSSTILTHCRLMTDNSSGWKRNKCDIFVLPALKSLLKQNSILKDTYTVDLPFFSSVHPARYFPAHPVGLQRKWTPFGIVTLKTVDQVFLNNISTLTRSIWADASTSMVFTVWRSRPTLSIFFSNPWKKLEAFNLCMENLIANANCGKRNWLEYLP